MLVDHQPQVYWPARFLILRLSSWRLLALLFLLPQIVMVNSDSLDDKLTDLSLKYTNLVNEVEQLCQLRDNSDESAKVLPNLQKMNILVKRLKVDQLKSELQNAQSSENKGNVEQSQLDQLINEKVELCYELINLVENTILPHTISGSKLQEKFVKIKDDFINLSTEMHDLRTTTQESDTTEDKFKETRANLSNKFQNVKNKIVEVRKLVVELDKQIFFAGKSYGDRWRDKKNKKNKKFDDMMVDISKIQTGQQLTVVLDNLVGKTFPKILQASKTECQAEMEHRLRELKKSILKYSQDVLKISKWADSAKIEKSKLEDLLNKITQLSPKICLDDWKKKYFQSVAEHVIERNWNILKHLVNIYISLFAQSKHFLDVWKTLAEKSDLRPQLRVEWAGLDMGVELYRLNPLNWFSWKNLALVIVGGAWTCWTLNDLSIFKNCAPANKTNPARISQTAIWPLGKPTTEKPFLLAQMINHPAGLFVIGILILLPMIASVFILVRFFNRQRHLQPLESQVSRSKNRSRQSNQPRPSRASNRSKKSRKSNKSSRISSSRISSRSSKSKSIASRLRIGIAKGPKKSSRTDPRPK